jgi:CDP-6-deoxy-D-xylo-4-hexulose-3-dehydrase
VGDLTNADNVTNNTFWIGLYPGLGEDHLSYVTETLQKFVKGSDKSTAVHDSFEQA